MSFPVHPASPGPHPGPGIGGGGRPWAPAHYPGQVGPYPASPAWPLPQTTTAPGGLPAPQTPGSPAALTGPLPQAPGPGSPGPYGAPFTPGAPGGHGGHGMRPAPGFAGLSRNRHTEIALGAPRTTPLFLLCLMGFFGNLGGTVEHQKTLGLPTDSWPVTALTFAGLAMLAAFFFRKRWPVAVTLLSALAGALLRSDTTVGLIAFTTVVRRARSLKDRGLWASGTALLVGTGIALWFESKRAPTGNSLIGIVMLTHRSDGQKAIGEVSPLVIPVFLLVAMAVPILVGLLLRSNDATMAARRRAYEEASVSARIKRDAGEQARNYERLSDTLDLQAERERVAREIHDGLGHRLSLLALHAGALEQGILAVEHSEDARASADGTDDPGEDGFPQEAARHVREEAQAAMRDLRSLLTVLREPVGAAEPAPRLEDLRAATELVNLPRARSRGRRGPLPRGLPDRPGVVDQRPQARARDERAAPGRGRPGHRDRHHLHQPDTPGRQRPVGNPGAGQWRAAARPRPHLPEFRHGTDGTEQTGADLRRHLPGRTR